MHFSIPNTRTDIIIISVFNISCKCFWIIIAFYIFLGNYIWLFHFLISTIFATICIVFFASIFRIVKFRIIIFAHLCHIFSKIHFLIFRAYFSKFEMFIFILFFYTLHTLITSYFFISLYS